MFHQKMDSIEQSLRCAFELINNKPEMLVEINADDIPVSPTLPIERVRAVLNEYNPYNKRFVAHLLMKLKNQEDEDLVKLLFANLSVELVNHKIASLLVNNELAALHGMMYNRQCEVIERIIAYKSEQFPFTEALIELMKFRIRQINGGILGRMTGFPREYESIIEVLNANNNELIEKNSSSWHHTLCDNLNSSKTNFRIPKNFATINLLDIDEINSNRALIGQGYILFNSASKAMIYEIAQEKQYHLTENQYASISSERIIVCNETLIYIYESDGALKTIEVLGNPIAVAPKTINNYAYFLDINGKFYTYDLVEGAFVAEEQFEISEPVIDFIVYEKYMVLATIKSVMIKATGNTIRKIHVENKILSLIGDNGSFFVTSANGIGKYDFNANRLSFYNYIVNPTTNVVVVEENKIAFGYKNRLIHIVFEEVVAQQSSVIELNSQILDLIVCDNTVTVLCSNGEVINLINGQQINVEIEPVNYIKASLSVGSGVMCISSENQLFVCKVSA
ncbi:hypothetical protein [Paenibacillus massiliensis]|uniref:hypothetical protein n=1 Tax=Paenibacillus massiliensis TaxID=225917 RepID=UPI0012EC5208|nr:hypothetical protein [Paenibacillus massiliensis]